MKTTIQVLFLGIALSFLAACNNAPKGEQVDAGDAMNTEDTASAEEGTITYAVNTNESKVEWTGSKLVGKQHTGYLLLKEGQLMVSNGNISGGEFVIDMSSLTDTDLSAGNGKEKLEGHLKSEDFFHVEEYPTATFTVGSVEAVEGNSGLTHRITGNLTMKGNTKSITIPANVSLSENELRASTPQFTIDRTQWEVMYGSGALGVAQDEIINDKVGLKINLIAAPQQADVSATEEKQQESK